jgi:glycosyltransferase involved in cell wall biosynthesis
MHILIATPAFPPFIGGGERHTGTLAQHLARRGHTVTVLTSAARQEPDFWQGCGQAVEVQEDGKGVTVIKTPMRPFPGGFRGLLAWRKGMVLLSALPGTRALLQAMARRVPPLEKVNDALGHVTEPVDLVHGFNISWEHAMMAGWRYARRQGCLFVASPLAHLGTGPRDPVARNSMMRHQRHMLSTADLLLTNTSSEARGLRERGIKDVEIKVAGPGVDQPQSIATLPGAAASYEPYVLFLGRTSYDKGAMHAVQAVLRLRRQGSNLQLLLIGRETGEFQQFYQNLPPEDRRAVHVLGFVEEAVKHAYLKQATALLLPSRTDSFGIVLLEAWLYARPVVAARAGGIPDVVDEGQNGLLVPFGDIPALTGAIQVLLENEPYSRELGENGRKKLLAQYTWEAVTTKVLAAYQELLEGRQPAAGWGS